MQRRAFLTSAVLLPLIGVQPARVHAANEGWRTFSVTTKVELTGAKGPARVWLPLPLAPDTDYQRALGNEWRDNASEAGEVKEARYGAPMLYAQWNEGVDMPSMEVESRFVTRDRSAPSPAEPSADELKLYLAPTKLIPTDGLVFDTARKIVKDFAKDDFTKAQDIYQWVVENTFREAKVQGCGIGDITAMLETGNLGGKCADINALFVGLCRAAGVAARDVYGIRVADSRWGFKSLGKSGEVSKAQHCRAEFYSAKHGWVPVDPGDVRKVVLEEKPGLTINDPIAQEARERLFGSWEMNWLAYNYAHDVALPGSTGKELGYFMYPQAETVDGRRESLKPEAFRYQIFARELTT
jgi:transglutaminase-like putative cysteine protease